MHQSSHAQGVCLLAEGVCPPGGSASWQGGLPSWQGVGCALLRVCPPGGSASRQIPPPRYGQQEGGTDPTGVHTRLKIQAQPSYDKLSNFLLDFTKMAQEETVDSEGLDQENGDLDTKQLRT